MRVKAIEEPCIFCESWVEIDSIDEMEVAVQEARNLKLNQIQLTLPIENALSPEQLSAHELNRASILLTVSISRLLSCSKNTAESPFFLSDERPKQPLSFVQCELLLSEQANYHARLAPQFYRQYSDFDQKRYERVVTSDLTEESSFYAYSQSPSDQVIGLGLASQKGEKAILWELVVLGQYRNQGIARSLLHRLATIGNRRGVRYLEADVWWSNPALSFYAKIGFTQTSHVYVRYL